MIDAGDVIHEYVDGTCRSTTVVLRRVLGAERWLIRQTIHDAGITFEITFEMEIARARLERRAAGGFDGITAVHIKTTETNTT